MKNILFFVTFSLVLAGCLQTRNDVKEIEQRQVMQQQVVTLQKSNADVTNKFSEIDENLRILNGKIEVVENQVHKGDQQALTQVKTNNEKTQEVAQKINLLEESMLKMEQQIAGLQAEITALKADGASSNKGKPAASKGRASFEQGLEHFNQKDWKKAIVSFQKYRDDNPKGKSFAEATYRIGVCFQELGLKEEAKTFYQEVLTNFPKSDEAKRAKTRMKGLK